MQRRLYMPLGFIVGNETQHNYNFVSLCFKKNKHCPIELAKALKN